jgi:hypothetical protein
MPIERRNPLCDQMHGAMSAVSIKVTAPPFGELPAFQCRVEICKRIYTPASGYRSWVEGIGPGAIDTHRPICKAHRCSMYVADTMGQSSILMKYACPEMGCHEAEQVKIELDTADGYWKRVASTE